MGGYEQLDSNMQEILDELGIPYESAGADIRIVHGAASLSDASKKELSFCYYDTERAVSAISRSDAGVILCKNSMKNLVSPKSGQQLIFTENPRLAFVRATNKIYHMTSMTGISPHSVISDDSKIGYGCYIGHFAVIGKDCIIGDNCIIGDSVNIVQNTEIGNDCIIQQGVTIGADGFAFERHIDGKLERFPHLRGVKVGNNVEICANSSIARGSLSYTSIGNGTKIDALVHLAHNVTIGEKCELTAGTVIGGSTKLGNSCWTGLNSMIKDNIKIGNNVIVGAAAGVIHDVEDGDIVAGVPAKSIKHKVTSNLTFLMAGQQKSEAQIGQQKPSE
jgi:UDP-3-O-[3-hydroxymyristoyl] glucosamine N-acyltransferase